jgi:hypothetical protein
MQFECILFAEGPPNVAILQFFNERRASNHHHTLGSRGLEALGQLSVMFLAEVAVALIGELTVLRRIQKEEAVGIVVLLKDLLEACLQDRRPREKLSVLGVVQFGPRNRLVASLRDIELTLLVLPKHPSLTRFAFLLELASPLQIIGRGTASNCLLRLLVVGVVLHEGSDLARFSHRHRPLQGHKVRMDIRKHPL